MHLIDPNHQVVATQKVKTNSFGSAPGEFLIPQGRLLGLWQVMTLSPQGGASVRVEEYKRPTFEVTLKEPKEALTKAGAHVVRSPADMGTKMREIPGK